MGRKSAHSGRSLFFITPPMCRLDIVRVVISPSPAHSFRILVVRNDVVVVGELFVAEGTYARLLSDLTVQQLPHLGRRSKLPISTRVARVLDPLYAYPDQSGLVFFSYCFSATAKQRSVHGTIFIATQSHDRAPKLAFRGLLRTKRTFEVPVGDGIELGQETAGPPDVTISVRLVPSQQRGYKSPKLRSN
jgi:hypothetical protein